MAYIFLQRNGSKRELPVTVYVRTILLHKLIDSLPLLDIQRSVVRKQEWNQNRVSCYLIPSNLYAMRDMRREARHGLHFPPLYVTNEHAYKISEQDKSTFLFNTRRDRKILGDESRGGVSHTLGTLPEASTPFRHLTSPEGPVNNTHPYHIQSKNNNP